MFKSFSFHYSFAATFEASYYLSLSLKVGNRVNMYQREGEEIQGDKVVLSKIILSKFHPAN
jgi:hypothetical protein